MTDLTFHLHDLILFIGGYCLCFIAIKKSNGERILPKLSTIKKEPPAHVLDDDLVRCQLSVEEEMETREGRIPTRNV